MATSRLIEFETGTTTGWIHPHNGYDAGDFSTPRHEIQTNVERE
jgi:hypothetical protein